MELSLVVPTKNRPDDLSVALHSIFRQISHGDELLIVDQSDVNQKALCMRGYHGIGEVQYIHCPDRVRSLVQAKHFALERARSDVIVFLEDDIELCDHYLRLVREIFTKYPFIIGGCGVERNPSKSSWIYKKCFNATHVGMFRDKRVGVRCDPNYGLNYFCSSFLSGGISFYRKAELAQVGFDTENDIFALEDINLSVAMARKFGEHAFGIFPGVCLIHHRSVQNRCMGKARWRRKMREYRVFYQKFRGSWLDSLSYRWLASCLFFLAVFETITSRSFASIRGYLEGIRE